MPAAEFDDQKKLQTCLSQIRGRMLSDCGVNTDYQVSLEQCYLRRAERLGYEHRNPLFQTSTEILESKSIDESHRFLASEVLGIKPLDDATLVLCDLYREKYGIQMLPLLPDKLGATACAQISGQLAESCGQPIGLIVPCGITKPQHNYKGHVAPCIIQQLGDQIQILNLDSLPGSQPNLLLLDFMRTKSAENIKVIQFALEDKRQSSKNGCKVDAIQTLKDVLVYYQRSQVESLYELMGGQNAGRITDFKRFAPNCEVAKLTMPSFLHKTVQRSSFLKSQRHEPDTRTDPRAVELSGFKTMTIEQHRTKYLAPMSAAKAEPETRKKQGNHFLVVKSFHQINKVLEKLESFESATDRQHYLRCISHSEKN